MAASQRKKRAANFDSAENRFLVDLVVEHKNVLENKRSDAVTWNEKTFAWNEIAIKFNSTSGKCHRTAEALRAKYETIKKELRKKAANIKKELFITGGGTVISIPKYMDFEEKLLGIISMSVEGLPSVGDCDASLSRQEEIISENLAGDGSEEIDVIVENMQTTGSHETTLNSTNIIPVVIPLIADDSANRTAEVIISDPVLQTPSKKWKPDSLKSQKSAQLHVKKRPTTSAHDKFSKLAEAKNELVILQHNAQQIDADFKLQENNLKLKLLQEELNQKIRKTINDEEIHRKTVEIHTKTVELLEKQIEEQNLKIEILELQRKLN